MPFSITNWKVWPAATHGPKPSELTLHLFVHELSGLPLDGLRWSPDGELAVQVEWRGGRRGADALFRRARRGSTSRCPARPDGVVSWEEGLSHPWKPRVQNAGGEIRRGWIVHLEIHGFGFRSYGRSPAVIGSAQIDAAAYAHMTGKSLNLPVSCDVNGSMSIGQLTVTMEFVETKGAEKKPAWGLLRGISLSFNQRGRRDEDSGGGPAIRPEREVGVEEGRRRRLASASFGGGGEAGTGRTNSLRVLIEREAEERVVVVEEGGVDVGRWERRRVVSRNGGMEMVTEVFFASIDQCSERAAGEGACAVLATLVADWLHNNKRTLPLRQQFDEMIRAGSYEWRALCRESTHRRRFSDRHFDLDTVLDAKLRPIALVTPLSFVGFFALDHTHDDGLEYLDHAMSFDTVFDELLHAPSYEDERIYIASWNDHFFVLKITPDAIYLIDTLGKRLHEGCNQAYILKFGEGSVIRRVPTDESGELTRLHDEVVCEGMETCRLYMKEFLAAVPLREIAVEIERGAVSHADVQRRLQIEFHYTVPLPSSKDRGAYLRA